MFTEKDITVYVPYYNSAQTIEACIDSLLKQRCKFSRLVIINDGSQQALPKTISVEVHEHTENKGLAAGRNTALSLCETPLIASVDADVIADEYWLESLLTAINETDAAGVAGRMDEHYQLTLGDKWRAVHMAQHWGDNRLENPRFLYGANTLMQVDKLRLAGGFDTRCRTNNEDRTMCDSLRANGEMLIYQPQARCRHLRKDSTESILRAYWGWHHMKGLQLGDFNSTEGLISRIEKVNFGIGTYRYEMDKTLDRNSFLPLDYLLPLVFSCFDLNLYVYRHGKELFDFSSLLKCFELDSNENIKKFIPNSGSRSFTGEFVKYEKVFKEQVEKFTSNKFCSNLPQWLCENVEEAVEIV